ncbi:hypothetical protein HK096_003843, partial [Nowakowskiella sp. JEL0078]
MNSLFSGISAIGKVLERATLSERQRLRENSKFELDILSSLGLNSAPAAIAYDPSQSVLSLGLYDGRHFIIGNGFVHQFFESFGTVSTSMEFAIGDKFLLYLSSANTIRAQLLTAGNTYTNSLPLSHSVTCLVWFPFSRWAVCGTTSGAIIAIHCNSNAMNTNENPLKLSQTIIPPIFPISIVAMTISPNDNTKLLIAYENNAVVLWDFVTKSEINRFVLKYESIAEFIHDEKNVSTNAIAWAPDGIHFVSAHANLLVFWSVAESGGWFKSKNTEAKPLLIRPVFVEESTPKKNSFTQKAESEEIHEEQVDAVYKLEWLNISTENSDNSILVVGGGLPIVLNTNLSLFDFNTAKNFGKFSNLQHKLFPLPFKCVEFLNFIVDDIFPTIAVLTTENVQVFRLSLPDLTLMPHTLPASLHLQNLPPLLCSSYSESTRTFFSDLMSLYQEPGTIESPFKGGMVMNRNGKQTTDIVITVHEPTCFELWHMSTPTANHIATVDVTNWIETMAGIQMDSEQKSIVIWGDYKAVVLKLVAEEGFSLSRSNSRASSRIRKDEPSNSDFVVGGESDIEDIMAKVDEALERVEEENKRMKMYMHQSQNGVKKKRGMVWSVTAKSHMRELVETAAVASW